MCSQLFIAHPGVSYHGTVKDFGLHGNLRLACRTFYLMQTESSSLWYLELICRGGGRYITREVLRLSGWFFFPCFELNQSFNYC